MCNLDDDRLVTHLLLALWNPPEYDAGIALHELPKNLQPIELLAHCEANGLVCFVRRNHITAPNKRVKVCIEEGYSVAELHLPKHKTPGALFHEAINEDVPDVIRLRVRLTRLGEGEASRLRLKHKVAKPTGPTSKSEQRAQWLAQAMLLVRDHPDWSDAAIAGRVGRDKSALSRSREYQVAAAMARGNKGDRHQGHVTVDPDSGLRDTEAYSDDPAERDCDD